MSGRSRRVIEIGEEEDEIYHNTRSRSQLRPTRRSFRLRPPNNRSRSRSENGRRRSDSEDFPRGDIPRVRELPSAFHVIVEIDRPSPDHSFTAPRSENEERRPESDEILRGRASSSQRSIERQVLATATGPGSILAGVESHLLLLRRSLLLLSHLARPTTVHFLEDKPPAPPTSSAFIDNIPESRINQPGVECSICLAKFRRGTRASVLPCKHQFHNKCIRPWLKKKNSCPLCRHELPSDEPSTARRINPSFRNMYEDFNTFYSEAMEASRSRVVLTERSNRADLSSSSSSSSSS